MKKIKYSFLIGISLFFTNNSWGGENIMPIAVDNTHHNAETAKFSAKEIDSRLTDAKLLLERNKTDAAIFMLQAISKADPDNYEVLLELGRIAVAEKNWAYAIQVFRKASMMRPEDIEVRLVLMDIYKAYQMPVQEIIVAKEVVALDSEHIIATRRLADLYQELAMLEDEVDIRRQLKRLVSTDYPNLKRLAVIFDESGQLREAALVYARIHKYHPEKQDDSQRLAAIYHTLDESFQEAEVVDQKNGINWMKSRAEKNLRKENNIYDPFNAGVSFKFEQEPTLDVSTVQSRVAYTRLRVRSSIDFGISAKYAHIHHKGVDLLNGKMDINSASVKLHAIQNWSGLDYVLSASVGVLHDDVSGRLFARNENINLTKNDFPFLSDPTFNSYGGTMPIATVQFTARPGLHLTYDIKYQHKIMDDLDARLDMFYQDVFSLSTAYEGNDKTEIKLRVDNGIVSDGNYRFHGLIGGYYNILATQPMYDYRGRRQGYFREDTSSFLRLGYEFEYFKDSNEADNEKYETFVKGEYRHKGILSAQTSVMDFGSDEHLLFNAKGSYSVGRTLNYRRGVEARLFYFKPDSGNELGFSYGFEEEKSTNQPENNLRIGGGTTTHEVSLYTKWYF